MDILIRNFPETPNSKKWGLSVFSFGELTVPPMEHYPLRSHFKDTHHFWARGRRLDHLFLVYVSAGSGEAQFGSEELITIEAGTVMVLYPGIWHRYRPMPRQGWTEHWLGVKGSYVDMLLANYKFFGARPSIKLADDSKYPELLDQLRALLLEESIGYQVKASGLLIALLGEVYLQGNEEGSHGSRMEEIIKMARVKIQELAPHDPLDVSQLAQSLEVSYSWFRKMFKQYTGYAPAQYRIHINIRRASELLIKTQLTVKEIAFQSGFESEAYFCRQFKQKQGMSPSEFRTR
ncbi:AraC family transcriptional regulator [Reichenbachiella carrageenanivorans]|uniref:AraC family transcriptional regulator n=1 Tax=Reichenbachiella carrageenanivorans TaxID=2979869 RepID=A0ABY6D7G8_9BACT|nr:AraC family transcriptional regulator [Reichenbachiella carrageenanivorans]UXX81013.1 AraC family transcriptional regulator [Reichenbachiella carrageenanivorans]